MALRNPQHVAHANEHSMHRVILQHGNAGWTASVAAGLKSKNLFPVLIQIINNWSMACYTCYGRPLALCPSSTYSSLSPVSDLINL